MAPERTRPRAAFRGRLAFFAVGALLAASILCSTSLAGQCAAASLAAAPPRSGFALHELHLDLIKAVIAGLGLLVLLWAIAVRRAGQPDADSRPRDALLLALGLAGALAWPNLFKFHFDNHTHIWEHFHYYLGAKYSRELGYTRLYECVAVADMEAGLGQQVLEGKVRDLRTNRIVPARTAPAIREPGLCKARFSDERWRAFAGDVAFFRGRSSPSRWAELRQDHGFNASPVWALLGTPLANLAPASDAGLLSLALVDSLLLVALFGCVLWAFGWRALCVALIFFGTNYPARFSWNGGALLRMDWLAASIIGICLVRRGRMTAGGFALAYAALLRVFPALLVAGLVLKVLGRMVRERRLVLAPEHRRFALGAALALATLVPLSLLVPGTSWPGFLQNTAKHGATWATNHVGLKTVLAYSHASRGEVAQNPSLEEPWAPWKEARGRVFNKRLWLFVLLLGTFVFLLGRAVQEEEDWVALVLSIGLVPFSTYLACYYSSLLLGYALLFRRGREGIGAALAGLSLATFVVQLNWPWWDERYMWTSVAMLVFVMGTVLYRTSTIAVSEQPEVSGRYISSALVSAATKRP